MSGLGTTFQIIIAVTLVVLLFAVGFAIYNLETMKAIQDAGKQKRRVDIFKGVKDLPTNGEESYDTRDNSVATYKDLTASVNQGSGAEFTYNFWLYIDHDALGLKDAVADKQSTVQKTDAGLLADSGANDPKNIVLFMRGNKTPRTYKNICGENKIDIITKSPLVKLERRGDVLTVEFNTLDAPDLTHESSRNVCRDRSTNWATMNNHKIAVGGLRSKPNLVKKWFMITLVIADTTPADPLPLKNKIRTTIYVNGVLELERYTDGRLVTQMTDDHPTVLLQNSGNLYIYPEIKNDTVELSYRPKENANSKGLMMADMSYFNYALTPEEITSLFQGGFTKSMAPKVSLVSDVNKQDIMTSMSLAPDKKQKQLRAF